MIIKQLKIYLTIILISLQGCSVFNDVFKSSKKNKSNTEVSVDKESITKIEDKSKTVIEEKVDTVVYTKPSIKHVSTPGINNLSDISNLLILSNDLLEIRQTYDTLSKMLKTKIDFKPQSVNVVINKKTTIDNNISTEISAKTDSTYKNSNLNKEAIKQKEPKNVFWYVVLGLGGLAIVYFISKKFL